MMRDPYDGQPFYCKICGAGWNEYGACEETDCKLETIEEAQARAFSESVIVKSEGENDGE
jgi:hypothetical protein